MKYEEFKNEVEALGFVFEDYVGSVWVEDRECRILARVDKHYLLCVDMDFCSYLKLTPDVRKNIFDLCVELSKTPLEEREPVKKYYLKHKFLPEHCLNFHRDDETYFISDLYETGMHQTKFTIDEIKQIKQKHGVTLEDWELVEVEE